MLLRNLLHLLLTTLSLLPCPTLADPPSFWQSKNYELGKHGIYSELKFESSDLVAPRVNFVKWAPECEDNKLYFLAPRGLILGHEGPMILDQRGHMIWHREDKELRFDKTYGLQVQEYKGEKVLTMWSGNDQVVGHGSGYYYIFDQNYRLIKKIDAIGRGLTGDLHEFRILPGDTALLTSYESIPYDLSQKYNKSADSYIFDCIFQEVDLETNEKLFEWRSIDHFGLNDCYNPPRASGSKKNPFDYFHINSVDKDPNGDYLISARYSHAISKISGKTGEILWNLGGKNNSFTDLSDGKATNISWQHDARWQDSYSAITLFNNAEYFAQTENPAYGLKIAVDQDAMTATVVNAWHHPDHLYSESQGSVQMLPNGNAFLGYGAAAALSEFNAQGDLLCDIHYGALYYKNGNYSPNAVVSYRAFKQEWHGFPYENPRVKFSKGHMYVSWNGATEVKWWTLEASRRPYPDAASEHDWAMLGTIEKQGFESNFSVSPKNWLTFRLGALDASAGSLGSWSVYAPDIVQRFPDEQFIGGGGAGGAGLAPSRSATLTTMANYNRAWFIAAVLITGSALMYMLFARKACMGLCLASPPALHARTMPSGRGIVAGGRSVMLKLGILREGCADVEKEGLVSHVPNGRH